MLADTRDPNSLSTRLRRARDVRLRALIQACPRRESDLRILDMGGTEGYWRRVGLDFLREQKARVTIVNLSDSEIASTAEDADLFSHAVGDACELHQFADNAFDLAHSNSVIEHVITWPKMKAFAAETRRLAPSYYVQTPYFWFPIDPHYYKAPLFHWLPRPIRARWLNSFAIAYSGKIAGVDAAYDIVDQARLLDRRQFKFLFPDAEHRFERFVGLAKSMVAWRQAPA